MTFYRVRTYILAFASMRIRGKVVFRAEREREKERKSEYESLLGKCGRVGGIEDRGRRRWKKGEMIVRDNE